MARIGIDIRVCNDHFPGIGRATYGLTRALAELPHGHTLIVLHNLRLANSRFDLAALGSMPGVEPVALPLSPFAPQNQWRVPLLARRLRLDLLHTPYYVAPYFGLPCPSVVTIYDIIGRRYPQYLSRRGRFFFERCMRLATRHATQLLTGSVNARDDLIYAYNLTPERVTAIPFGVEERFRPQDEAAIAALRQRYGLGERYVLYLGSNKPHKNQERLLRAWERVAAEKPALLDSWELVLAGHRNPRHDEGERFVRERGIPRVRFLPDVPDSELPALYSGAGLFAFVSFYEGFGLPVIEAMACGAPVICAYASSLPEVVGNAALTVDPFSPIEIAEGLSRLLANPVLRKQLRESGLLQARRYSWRRAALRTLEVYERLIS